jgi:hypothetical protein
MKQDIILSTGKRLTFTEELNGSHTINEVITESEWGEYCAIMKAQAQCRTGHRFIA